MKTKPNTQKRENGTTTHTRASQQVATRLAMILSVLPLSTPVLTGETLQGDVFTLDGGTKRNPVKVRLEFLPTDVYVETTYGGSLTVAGSLPDEEAARHLMNLLV